MPDYTPRIACRGCMCRDQPIFRPEVIAINESDPLSACPLDTEIAGLSEIAVRYLHRAELHAIVALDEAEGIPRRLVENGKRFDLKGLALGKRFCLRDTRKSRARQLSFCMQVDDGSDVDRGHAHARVFSQGMTEIRRTI